MCVQYTIKVNGNSYLGGKSTLTKSEKYARVFTKKNEMQKALTDCISKYKTVELIVSEVKTIRTIKYESK